MLKAEKTKLGWIVTGQFVHTDERGSIYQPYNLIELRKALEGITYETHDGSNWGYPYAALSWVQENIIFEEYGVIRGLHLDRRAWKLASCLHGHVRLALEKNGETEVFDLDDGLDRQILVPPGVANGHSVLTSVATFHYLWSAYYSPQETHAWNGFGIDWGVDKPILSERDREAGV